MLKKPTVENCQIYQNLNKQAKAAVRSAKKSDLQKKVAKLEENFRKNDSFNLFKNVKDLEGKQKRSPPVIKDDNGVKHFKSDEILKL